ncbi:tetratricopeptide repeat protein [Candidatus Woesearchaeota archaeon]|nr:tetratricopeptide repeat protein [Candidatus Woesearchaeota archaeon]
MAPPTPVEQNPLPFLLFGPEEAILTNLDRPENIAALRAAAKKRYRNFAGVVHPDCDHEGRYNGAFNQINQAWETIQRATDDQIRAYVAILQNPGSGGGTDVAEYEAMAAAAAVRIEDLQSRITARDTEIDDLRRRLISSARGERVVEDPALRTAYEAARAELDTKAREVNGYRRRSRELEEVIIALRRDNTAISIRARADAEGAERRMRDLLESASRLETTITKLRREQKGSAGTISTLRNRVAFEQTTATAARTAYESTIASLKSVIDGKRDPTAEIVLEEAKISRDKGDLTTSIGYCNIVLATHPQNHTAHYFLGTVYERMGRANEAIAEYKAAGKGSSAKQGTERVQKRLEEQSLHAKELRDNNKLDEGVTYCINILTRDPKNTPIAYFLATTYEKKGDLTAAERTYNSILESSPKHSSAKTGLERVRKALTE